MRTRPTRALEVLSISALDLFASALGVFMLVAVLLFPFYLKAPSVQAALQGARLDAATAQSSLVDARRQAAEGAERRADARARLDQAQAALVSAEAEERAAQQALAAAESAAQAAPRPPAAATSPRPARQPGTGGTMSIGDLDLVFVMDTTGSMRREIRDVQRGLLSIIRVLERLTPSLRIGFVAFKDRADAYLTQSVPLSAMDKGNLVRMQSFVKQLSATGGGDNPEPVEIALAAALNMSWRGDAKGRIVVIGDAPAHARDWAQTFATAVGFHGSGSGGGNDRRVSAIFTGGNREGRAFYERLAAAGGGDFVSHRGQMLESILLSVL